MPTVEVITDLPFLLRLEESLTVGYDQVCQEYQLQEFVGQDVRITFHENPQARLTSHREVVSFV